MKQPQDKFTLEIPEFLDGSIAPFRIHYALPEDRVHALVDVLGERALADVRRTLSSWRRSIAQKRRRERERWLRAHQVPPRQYVQRLVNEFYNATAFSEIATRTYEEAPSDITTEVRVC